MFSLSNINIIEYYMIYSFIEIFILMFLIIMSFYILINRNINIVFMRISVNIFKFNFFKKNKLINLKKLDKNFFTYNLWTPIFKKNNYINFFIEKYLWR